MDLGLGRWLVALKKIKVAPAVGLGHVFDIKFCITPGIKVRVLIAYSQPSFDFILGNIQFKSPPGNIQGNQVTILHSSQCPAGS